MEEGLLVLQKMRRAVIVSSPNAYRMNSDLVANALEIHLRKQGRDVLQLTRDARPPVTRSDDVLFFLQLGVPDLFRSSAGTKVIFNFHPTAPDGRYGPHAERFFKTIKENVDEGWADYVFEYNPHTAGWMQEKGIPAIFCPLGYHWSFDRRDMERLPGNGTGVYFVGRAKGSRGALIAACEATVFLDVWGEERIRICRTEGIHLSLASYGKFRTCLTLRLIVLLASNGCAIVHEKTDWCPLENGLHCLIGTAEELPLLVEVLRQDPRMRQTLRENSYHFVRTKHRFDDHLDRAMAMASML